MRCSLARVAREICSLQLNDHPLSRLLFPRQTGLLLGFADETHCTVELAVVAVVGAACDAEADL